MISIKFMYSEIDQIHWMSDIRYKTSGHQGISDTLRCMEYEWNKLNLIKNREGLVDLDQNKCQIIKSYLNDTSQWADVIFKRMMT
jgi:hypothetical protein